MTRIVTTGLLAALVVGFGLPGSRVAAQESGPALEVTAPPPPPPAPGLGLEPTLPPDQPGSREAEFYPGPVRSLHQPVFVTPFVATVPVPRASVRVGLSAWTAPAVPFDIREASGGVAIGFTVVWEPATDAGPAPETPAAGER